MRDMDISMMIRGADYYRTNSIARFDIKLVLIIIIGSEYPRG